MLTHGVSRHDATAPAVTRSGRVYGCCVTRLYLLFCGTRVAASASPKLGFAFTHVPIPQFSCVHRCFRSREPVKREGTKGDRRAGRPKSEQEKARKRKKDGERRGTYIETSYRSRAGSHFT